MKDIKIETKENKYYSSEDNIINDLIEYDVGFIRFKGAKYYGN